MERSHKWDHSRDWLIAIGLVLAGLLFWYASSFVMLVFTAILIAVFLWGLADWLRGRTGLAHGWCLTITVILLLGVMALTGWLLAPEIGKQAQRLSEEVPKAWNHFEKVLGRQPWGPQIQSLLPDFKPDSQLWPAFRKASGVVSTTLGGLVNVVIVAIVAIYLASEPRRYVGGFIRLLPQRARERADELFTTLGRTLRHWLVGRFVLMVSNAIITAIGLALLGLPLALTLGLLSGLLNFIPNLGPIIAAVPAVLLAFVEGPSTALYVIIFYTAYQMIDGYVFTPLVQRKTVSLPPAVTILAQVLVGLMWGIMGVLLAVPLAAVILVTVKMLYIEDALGEPVKIK